MDSSIGIGDLATILTAAGVMIYVLGLIGLAIPIYRTFADDLSTAWYAVSMLPRTVVAGQGVRIWFQWPFFITVVLLLTKGLLSKIKIEGDLEVLGVLLVGYGFLSYISRRVTLAQSTRIPTGEVVVTRWGRIAIGNALALVGIFVVTVVAQPDVGNPLIYILWVIAGSFLIGLPMAITADPPLPKVEITKHAVAITEANSIPTEVGGYLLTHSDGYWHVFDDNNRLLSIPDAQVLEVRTRGRQSHDQAHMTRQNRAASSRKTRKRT